MMMMIVLLMSPNAAQKNVLIPNNVDAKSSSQEEEPASDAEAKVLQEIAKTYSIITEVGDEKSSLLMMEESILKIENESKQGHIEHERGNGLRYFKEK